MTIILCNFLQVSEAIHQNALSLTPVKDFEDSKLPRNCALLESPVLCRYALKLLPPITSPASSPTRTKRANQDESAAAATSPTSTNQDASVADDSGIGEAINGKEGADSPPSRHGASPIRDEESKAPSEPETFYVCQLSRNRLAAVCDCVTYLRYIHQGLVKSHGNDVYWELMRLRKQMGLARLGYMPEA